MDDILKEQIVSKLNTGMSLIEVCNEMNLVYNRIYYHCKKKGVHLSRGSNGKSKTTLISYQKKIIPLLKEVLYDG